ncbi:MAG: alanine--tRNA ligase [Endomicrobium sp.]|jgi:alanyl-tRNA synthetase|nr:alanine--tRNA ligase [Endomicrobium sp.]
MAKQSSKIRTEFLEFFKNSGSTIVPSDSLIPAGDKTLLFTSAGMVQFKQHFLGHSKDSFTTAASCQKCFRTSDIEQVGVTTRHLTFFEMLGNFSFGDYFKKEAIEWAWKFLTKNIMLPKNKLYVTVYKDDDEAVKIWKKIVPENRIIRMDEETNFWNMGVTGPCGPCSEILIDLGSDMSCGKPTCGYNCNCGRYLEIWNLVFTQFNRQLDGSLKNLPSKSIDTGMGLERIVAAENSKKSIFDTDLFMPIIENAADILKIKNEGKNRSKLRMIADHSRAVTFLISDGLLPSNEGRGYVLRRILRRALRQGKLYGHNKPFINELTAMVFKIMEPSYPELSSKFSNIKSIIKIEEENFLEKLDSASVMVSKVIGSYKSKGTDLVDGKEVFKLYDTYGFPYDLTKEIILENGLIIDESGFQFEQKNAQARSRASWSGSGANDMTLYSALYKITNDTIFTGYEKYISEGRVLNLLKDGKKIDKLKIGDSGEILLSQSSFYAQSGGQSADRGKILNGTFESIVIDVLKPIGGLFVHKVKVLKGLLQINDVVSTIIDIERRKQITRHHTATHILHRVLREFFGKHVVQSGSFVTNDCLRFDFTHFSSIKDKDLVKIEKKINYIIRTNSVVYIENMNIAQARDLGAIALFGEKYGNIVRTVSIKNEDGNDNYSIELCGGTHVNKTGDIGFLKIVSESSIGTGVRRIEAVVGDAAEDYVLKGEETVIKLTEILNVSEDNLVKKIKKYVNDYNKLENKLNILNEKLILGEIDSYIRQIEEINGIKFLYLLIDNMDAKTRLYISDRLKEKMKSILLLIISKNDGKVSFLVSATEDYIQQRGIDSGEIANVFAVATNGSSGGKSNLAHGGSKNLLKLEEAIKNIRQYIETK